MLRHSVPVLILLVAIFAGCSSDGPTDSGDPSGDPISTVTIGPSGGKLETEDFELTVPAGAFGAETELALYLESEDPPYEDGTVTDHFRVDGLPEDFDLPLRMAIRYEGDLSGGSFIAIGEEAFVKSLGETTVTYVFLEAADSSGFLVCDLSIPEDYAAGSGMLRSAAGISTWLRAVGVSNLNQYRTSSGHFEMI